MALSSQRSATLVLYHEHAIPKKTFKPPGRDNAGSKTTFKPSGTDSSCGGQHLRHSYKFRDAECRKCNKCGHIQLVYRSRSTASNRVAANTFNFSEDSLNENFKALSVKRKNQHLLHTVEFERGKTDFIIDTGSPISIMAYRNQKAMVCKTATRFCIRRQLPLQVSRDTSYLSLARLPFW